MKYIIVFILTILSSPFVLIGLLCFEICKIFILLTTKLFKKEIENDIINIQNKKGKQ